MASFTIPALTLSAPTSLPTAGIGGSYYDQSFTIPVYSSATADQTTWRAVDNWNRVTLNKASSQGIAAGLIWASLMYLLALTPSRKRTTPFHTLLLVGLVVTLIHLMIDLVAMLTPGLQSLPAYPSLTKDVTSSTWPRKFTAVCAASSALAWIAFALATVCLWLQAKGLMTGIRVRFPVCYQFILVYLIMVSVAALATSMASSIKQVVSVGHPNMVVQDDLTVRLTNGYLALYATCIGSYSLVSVCSIVDIIWRRPSSVIKGHNVYSSALNLVGLLCAQSFFVPLILCILQIIPFHIGLMQIDILLLPAVYLLLPVGSLFMTVNSRHHPGCDAENQKGAFPPDQILSPAGRRSGGDRSLTLTLGTISRSRSNSYATDPPTHDGHSRTVYGAADRGLAVESADGTLARGRGSVSSSLDTRGTVNNTK